MKFLIFDATNYTDFHEFLISRIFVAISVIQLFNNSILIFIVRSINLLQNTGNELVTSIQ